MRKKFEGLIDDQRKILKLYAVGALLFFIGIGLIQWADRLIEPSLQQESYALLGTIVGGSGFFTSMIAQVLLIILRFRKMGKKS
jgi:hypothetical protein